MTKQNEEKLREVHSKSMKDFDSVQSAVHDERLQSLKDRRFYSIAGAQWEGKLGEQFENKPKFEVNKVHLAVIRIISEYRNNRITVDFTSKEGIEGDKLADTCDDLYRADEQNSTADEAYDNAFEEAVGGGLGAWRLRAEYEDEEDEEDERQRIKIEPIQDADSTVFFDLDAKRQDKADAKQCWVLTPMSVEAYIAEYDDDPASWPKDVEETEFDWASPDVVFVAEHYVVEMAETAVHVYKDLTGEESRYTDADFEADEDLEYKLESTGSVEVRTKKVKRKRIHKYIESGSKVLEDCGLIAGNCIPIVLVYGKRWFVDNIERCMGHVRLAKDPQRLKNMQLSKLGELSALSSTEKPILTPEQVAGHEVRWAEDNIADFPYMLVNPITDAAGNSMPAGPIGYTKPPMIPPAMAALLQITETDMQEILGGQQNGEKIVSNIAEDTVLAIHERLDMQSFIYMSNFAKGMKRCGEIWLGMARDLYSEEGRKMKGIGRQGEMSSIQLMKPVRGESGGTEYENDISKAKFDVAVDVGPSSSSRRSATVKSLTGMMQATTDPETQQVLQATAVMNMEGEGLGDIRDYYRKKLLRMGAAKPSEEEAEEMQEEAANMPPDANTQYLQSVAEEAEANAAKARADTVLTVSKASVEEAKERNVQADTVKKLAETEKIGTENVTATAQLAEEISQAETTQPPSMSENEE